MVILCAKNMRIYDLRRILFSWVREIPDEAQDGFATCIRKFAVTNDGTLTVVELHDNMNACFISGKNSNADLLLLHHANLA